MRDRRRSLGTLIVVTAGLALAYGPSSVAGLNEAGPACPADTRTGVSDPGYRRYEFTEPHMGTRFRIILYAADEATAKRASAAAFRRIAELDGIMSDYQPTSELMRLCAKAGGDTVPVSADLFAVLSRSQEIAKLTDGAFEVTVGPIVRLWRLSRRTQRLPDPEKLAAAKALVGYQNVVLDSKARTVTLRKAGMQLDLGGIAKGFAAQAAQETLKKEGITRALVAASGDIVLTGPPPDADGWTVGIGAVSEEEKTAPTLRLHDAAVSTSGDAFQYVEIGGKRYAHIVDPRTGMGMTDIYQVTVVARDGTTSDALATALVVMGVEEGLKVVEGMEGVSARFVRKTAAGIEEKMSTGFPK